MGTKKTTMQDIADSLGYSRTTVSKALNNASGISENTREIVLAIARAVSELRSIYSVSHTDNTIIYALEAPAHYMAWYYKELCKIFSLYAYEPITEHIYAEMVTLYKKVFMNIE